ncbi:MAG: hypothetical protein EAZ53_11105 [Bacteroidetes bacterium]|nr:MAG: hypothetical protein EAZ53_11105 [Bacteroidota bacterium]
MKKILLLLSITYLLITNKSFAQKCEGNCINGYGKLTYEDNSTFESEWVEGKPNEVGIYIVPNEIECTISFQDGIMDTKSIKIKFLNDNPKNVGIPANCFEKPSNVLKYVGLKNSNGCYHGQGTVYYKKGVKYSGEWKDGFKNGQGILTFPTNYVKEGNTHLNDGFTRTGFWWTDYCINCEIIK